VPWNVAWELSDADALGMVIAFGEISGAAFDWDRMQWRERR
jgi:hypothetical protein